MMFRTIVVISMMMLALSFPPPAPAQQAEQERDPFFSGGLRSVPTGTVGPQHDDGWGRDPFIRPFAGGPPVKQSPELGSQRNKLTGIICAGNKRVAIIDGETVREGSMIGNQKLERIRPSSIVLMDSTGNRTEIVLENFSIPK